jgi:plastocyanin
MRRVTRLTVVPIVLAMLVAGCGDDDSEDSTSTTEDTETSISVPDGIEVGVGINDPEDANIAVLEFLPANISVETGTDVTWAWQGTEPHSVTFLDPGRTLPPPGDPSVFGPEGADTTSYDGSTFVNTGLQPLGPQAPAPFTMAFSAPGTYPYYCVIHPGMVGEVTVTEPGGAVDTAEAVAERRADETDEWLAEGRAAKAALAAAEPEVTENADGSSTWTVLMGATTEHTDILAFAPTPAGVKAGDTVRFLNTSGAPHTASFFGAGAEPIVDPTDPRTDAAAPGPSPQTLSSSGFFNTGLLPPDAPPGSGPPEAARTFDFTVPEAGTYAYVCILHAPSQMTGVVTAT